jgi:hypothetical protein
MRQFTETMWKFVTNGAKLGLPLAAGLRIIQEPNFL